jgi:hypothetical protein
MSYSHAMRRKFIRKLKRKYGKDRKDWYPHFEQHRAQVVEELQGPCIGTLEDIWRKIREANPK